MSPIYKGEWLLVVLFITSGLLTSQTYAAPGLRNDQYFVEPAATRVLLHTKVTGFLGGCFAGSCVYRLGERLNEPVFNKMLSSGARGLESFLGVTALSDSWKNAGVIWGNRTLELLVTGIKIASIVATTVTVYTRIKNTFIMVANPSYLPAQLIQSLQQQICCLAIACSLEKEMKAVVSVLTSEDPLLREYERFLQQLNETIDQWCAFIHKTVSELLAGELAPFVCQQMVPSFSGTPLERLVPIKQVLLDMEADVMQLSQRDYKPNMQDFLKLGSVKSVSIDAFLSFQNVQSAIRLNNRESKTQLITNAFCCARQLMSGLMTEFNKQSRKIRLNLLRYRFIVRCKLFLGKIKGSKKG